MNLVDLQRRLTNLRVYAGRIDGLYGPMTRSAALQALTDPPDAPLGPLAYQAAADRLQVPVAAVRAVVKVEASGVGFEGGRPTLLFEPHRFSKATGHEFDATHPAVSYPRWDRMRYPRTQAERYDQMLEAVGLAVDAGFASASYGLFQILGENHHACGFDTPWDFAISMANGEAGQLQAFEEFLVSTGLINPLRRLDWSTFADGYNGTASRQNHYAEKLAQAYKVAGGV